MQMRNNKFLVIIFLIVIFISCSWTLVYVKADSGWDYSYDSGSSSSGGYSSSSDGHSSSSSSSSSGYSYSDSSNHSSSNGTGDGFTIKDIIFQFLLLVGIVLEFFLNCYSLVSYFKLVDCKKDNIKLRKKLFIMFILSIIGIIIYNLILIFIGLSCIVWGYVALIIFFVVLFVSLFIRDMNDKHKNTVEYIQPVKPVSPVDDDVSKNYIDMPKEKIMNVDSSINILKLKREVFTIYKNVQIAWMNMDYESLRKYTTDELYNMYESQLKVLESKKEKNIMEDIECNNFKTKIINVSINNGIETVIFYLNVKQFDYVVDSNNKVVRGNDKIKNNVEYIITLTRSVKNEKVDKCPNCGASIDIVSGGICPYCDSTIINSTDKFVMSKKECINQRRL